MPKHRKPNKKPDHRFPGAVKPFFIVFFITFALLSGVGLAVGNPLTVCTDSYTLLHNNTFVPETGTTNSWLEYCSYGCLAGTCRLNPVILDGAFILVIFMALVMFWKIRRLGAGDIAGHVKLMLMLALIFLDFVIIPYIPLLTPILGPDLINFVWLFLGVINVLVFLWCL